ncbi:histone-lysine N-methyltransferase NSD2-like isoform X2 [Dendronephthya gigantea]|uniref:histone-lysine N-methyltransferase NSD2-like isoform X2 n=1 Tax=Dendronephthya gigantea TaxID=151771 RepID=UPI00106A9F5A|nr:histone-lysine N-methyltransferase NSD2-like isoform X2 [Dendronephthya gigantea]
MSTPEVLAADQDGDNFLTKVENAVEFSADSLQVITPPESVKLRWKIGDIVWSKIPGHPWWPSLIAYEPNTEVYFKMKGRTRYYHVQFFGTEPLRGWVTERNILKYEGKTHFLSLRLSIHGKPHKIGTKQLPTWEKAIKMADETIPLDHQERQVCFNFFNVIETPSPAIEGKGDESLNSSKEWSSSPQTHSKEVSSPEGPPTKKTKVENGKQQSKTQGKNKRNSVKQRTPKRTSKTPPGKHVNNKLPEQMNNNLEKQVRKEGGFYVVEPSPTSCAFDMNTKPITPENGKRKRGRPRKDSVLVVGSKEDQQTVSPAKKTTNGKSLTKISALPNNLSSTSAESEKSDGASDTNSTSSIDTEIRRIVLKNKDICTVCEKPDNLLTCEGVCNSSYHKDCLKSEVPSEKFICEKCSTGNHTCFICNKTDNVIKCSFQNCGKFYHLDCIKTLDSKINGDSFVCPLHHCNVCGVSKSSNSKKRLTCCVRCPVAYHTGTCIVAGSMPITLQYLVCNRHFSADPKKAHHSHVNVNWCFVCSIGGTLICCESCPAAFHPECIEVTGIPEGHFFCRDCKDGKELLYGEIVWVKLGMYRWWPAQICNPNNIPNNIQRMKHQAGEFPVQFLGSHDYYWIHRGRVFSYQEGDKGSIGGGGKYLGEIFKKALVEAQDKYAEWLKIQEEKAEKDLEKLSKKPAAYKHIKVNRYTTATKYEIDESELSTCDCSINDENPCGPDSHCLNRILYVECSPLKCPAKEKCQNQCFVKRQHLSAEPFRALGRGWGLRAKADAKKGQFVNEYVGELINEETCRERVRKGINEGVVNYYMLTIDKDCIIDAGPMGNLSRFMNHSCDPNCETQKWTVNGEVRVGLFAKRDIKAGEELVFDYQLDCLGNEKKKCSCGSKNCSGFLGVRPKTQHALKLQEEKKKSHESKKRKKKTGTKKNIDEHEDECYDCGDGGELIMCSKTGCSKCYHLSCLTIDKIPHGDWLCPWHFCDDCGKAAMIRCQECSNSFCLAHAPGQINKTEGGKYVCDQHQERGLVTNDRISDITSTSIPSDDNLHQDTSEDSIVAPTNPINIPATPFVVSAEPTNDVPTDPTSVRTDPDNTPLSPTIDPTNPGCDPDTGSAATPIDPPTFDHTSLPNTPLDLTNVPKDPTLTPVNPSNDLNGHANLHNGPAGIYEDLSKEEEP